MKTSIKMMISAITGAMALGGIALANEALLSETTSATALSGERLKSTQIAKLRGAADQLPPYCEPEFYQDPFTGELICEAVICRPPNGPASIESCDQFGL